MKGVNVAAGLGLRLSPLTENCPKPLLPVQGRPLIDHTIEAFARAGFEELGIVLGHNEAMLACYLRESSNHGIAVCCLHNEQYQRGNGTSIYAARVFVGNEPFVVSMADHLISPQILSALLARPCDSHILCVDRETRDGPTLDDSTKVWLDTQGCVRRIGKRLKQWHAVDVGVFLFQPRVFSHIKDLPVRADGRCSITSVVQYMIACGDQLHTCDVSGAFWLDVDTPDDLVRARRALDLRAELAQPELVA